MAHRHREYQTAILFKQHARAVSVSVSAPPCTSGTKGLVAVAVGHGETSSCKGFFYPRQNRCIPYRCPAKVFTEVCLVMSSFNWVILSEQDQIGLPTYLSRLCDMFPSCPEMASFSNSWMPMLFNSLPRNAELVSDCRSVEVRRR